MPQILFRQKTLTRLAVFCLGISALTLAPPAVAGLIDYPGGTNNGSSIVLTDDLTLLQVLGGAATQSGVISESGGSYLFTKTGAGKLSLTGTNTYSGDTIIQAGTLALSGAGSISNSHNIALNNNILDISGTTDGASVKSLFSLSSISSVVLGSRTLTITDGIPNSGSSVFLEI